MIQRIQSLYLLFVAACMVAVAVLPLGVLEGDGLAVKYTAFNVLYEGTVDGTAFPVWLMGGVALLAALVALITIFLYKKRAHQNTLCTVNGFLIGLFYAIYAVFFTSIRRGTDVDFEPVISVAFPLVGLIFNILAMKAIAKDTALVESLNRLR